MTGAKPSSPYVSRGGLKLRHALDAFAIDPTGLVCADFGCNVGGYTDCLLKAGASRVYAVDTGYGELAWTLRNDARVVVMERTNALHAPAPAGSDGKPIPIALIAMDLAWTPQRLAIPAALRWLAPTGTIVSLVKPHYELEKHEQRSLLKRGILAKEDARVVTERVVASLPSLGVEVLGLTESPIQGGARSATGNTEWLVWLRRA
jgi:23S rRNA (cytidine1920-2'-O)/16S rRNA (cytidine1409-2'-O)-methyltransferase